MSEHRCGLVELDELDDFRRALGQRGQQTGSAAAP